MVVLSVTKKALPQRPVHASRGRESSCVGTTMPSILIALAFTFSTTTTKSHPAPQQRAKKAFADNPPHESPAFPIAAYPFERRLFADITPPRTPPHQPGHSATPPCHASVHPAGAD
jgi:hypothetical protein